MRIASPSRVRERIAIAGLGMLAAAALAVPLQASAASPNNAVSAAVEVTGCVVDGHYIFSWQGSTTGGFEVTLVDQTSGTTVASQSLTWTKTTWVGGHPLLHVLGTPGHTYVVEGRVLSKTGSVIKNSQATSEPVTFTGC